MNKVLIGLVCALVAGCVVDDAIDDVTEHYDGSGTVFGCRDEFGDTTLMCWDGTTEELMESTTWECRPASDFAGYQVHCNYRCPTPLRGDYWSWCPYDENGDPER